MVTAAGLAAARCLLISKNSRSRAWSSLCRRCSCSSTSRSACDSRFFPRAMNSMQVEQWPHSPATGTLTCLKLFFMTLRSVIMLGGVLAFLSSALNSRRQSACAWARIWLKSMLSFKYQIPSDTKVRAWTVSSRPEVVRSHFFSKYRVHHPTIQSRFGRCLGCLRIFAGTPPSPAHRLRDVRIRQNKRLLAFIQLVPTQPMQHTKGLSAHVDALDRVDDLHVLLCAALNRLHQPLRQLGMRLPKVVLA